MLRGFTVVIQFQVAFFHGWRSGIIGYRCQPQCCILVICNQAETQGVRASLSLRRHLWLRRGPATLYGPWPSSLKSKKKYRQRTAPDTTVNAKGGVLNSHRREPTGSKQHDKSIALTGIWVRVHLTGETGKKNSRCTTQKTARLHNP